MNVIAPPINKTTHSESTTHNFLKWHPNIKLSGSSGIDPACAAQVNDNVWEDYFCKLDAYINVLYKMGRLKWKSFAEIPAKNIYNMDEVGSDMTKWWKNIVKDAKAETHCFTIMPEGDKMPFHVMVCLTTRANGQYISNGILDGAPPPMIIHSKKATNPKVTENPKQVPEHLLRGLAPMGNDGKYIDGTDAYQNNNALGFLALATVNGSMKQVMMLPYAEHFVDHLPKNCDPQEGNILFLDGHSSWWDLPALFHLLKNNVFPFYYPSHTSIWSQANDCGANKWLHHCISDSMKDHRGTLHCRNYRPCDWNVVFRKAWEDFLDKEWADYHVSCSNSAIYVYEKTGIKPFNPQSSLWMDAIAHLGSSSDEQNKKFHRSFEIRVRNEFSLSESEWDALIADYIPIDNVLHNESDKTIRGAIRLGKAILARWWDAYETKQCKVLDSLDSSSESSSSSSDCDSNAAIGKVMSSMQQWLCLELENIQPEGFALTPKERMAMKVIWFLACDADSLPKPAVQSEEQQRTDYIRNVLAQTEIGGIVRVQKIGLLDGELKGILQVGIAMRRGPDKWTFSEKVGNTMVDVKLTSEDLIQKDCYNVIGDTLADEATEKQKCQQKESMRHHHKHESQCRQAAATAIAKERWEAMLREEYNKLVQIFSSGRHYSFDEFMALEKRLTDPFQCDVDIDGEQMWAFANHHEVGAFNLVLHRTITDELFSSKRSHSNDDDDGACKWQKRSNGGRCQPPTHNSEDGISVAEFLVNFDHNKGISDAESNKKMLEWEKCSLLTFHEKIVKFKEKTLTVTSPCQMEK